MSLLSQHHKPMDPIMPFLCHFHLVLVARGSADAPPILQGLVEMDQKSKRYRCSKMKLHFENTTLLMECSKSTTKMEIYTDKRLH